MARTSTSGFNYFKFKSCFKQKFRTIIVHLSDIENKEFNVDIDVNENQSVCHWTRVCNR
jgi:hypothetical protein